MLEPLRISNSVTAPAPSFFTLKVVGPEVTSSWAGVQPASVSETFTCFDLPPGEPEPDPALLPQPATIRPAMSSAMPPPATMARAGDGCAATAASYPATPRRGRPGPRTQATPAPRPPSAAAG